MINGAQEVGFLLLQRQISLSAIRYLLSIMVTNVEHYGEHFHVYAYTRIILDIVFKILFSCTCRFINILHIYVHLHVHVHCVHVHVQYL